MLARVGRPAAVAALALWCSALAARAAPQRAPAATRTTAQRGEAARATPAKAATWSDLAALVREAERQGVRAGVVVTSELGGILFQHRHDEPFVPASNQKLVTAAAALERLGPGYEFTTTFRLRDGFLDVVAGGDPNWRTGGAHDPAETFALVAAALRQRGVRRLAGVRLLDATFGAERRPASWDRYPAEQPWCAGSAGLALDAGCIRARVAAGAGAHAAITIEAPPVQLPILGGIDLVAERQKGSVYGLRDLGGRLQAFGALWRRAGERTAEIAARDPAQLFALSLEQALGAAGIDPAAGADAAGDLRAAGEAVLLEHRSSLVSALGPILRDSSNFHAEQVLRVLGAEVRGEGTFAGGAAVVREAITALIGEWPAGVVAADGSGLSRDNMLTPRFLARVLHAVQQRPWAPLMLDNLARGGSDGTLENRLASSPIAARVRAKTGTIRGVSALSGVVQLGVESGDAGSGSESGAASNGSDGGDPGIGGGARTGRRTFVILMNWDRETAALTRDLRRLQDRMVETIHDVAD